MRVPMALTSLRFPLMRRVTTAEEARALLVELGAPERLIRHALYFGPMGTVYRRPAVSLTARPLAGRTRKLLSLSAVTQTLILVPLGRVLSRVPR